MVMACGVPLVSLMAGLLRANSPDQSPAAVSNAAIAVGTGLVVGRAVDGDSDTPIVGAIVTVVPLAAAGPGKGPVGGGVQAVPGLGPGRAIVPLGGTQTSAMITNEEGWFAFRGLPPGPLSITAALPGYTGGGYNQRRPDGPSQLLTLTEGERVGDVSLRLWKLASLSGTITDEAGEPVVGAFVRILRRAIVGGQPILQLTGAGKDTDDRGVFRAFGLTPGNYVVCLPSTQTTIPIVAVGVGQREGATVAASDGWSVTVVDPGGGAPPIIGGGQRIGDLVLQVGGRGNLVAPVDARTSRMLIYQTQFYPGATLSSRATVITLKSGDAKTGVDMQVTPVRSVRVSGTITGPDGPGRGVRLHLVAADRDQDYSLDTAPDDIATTVSDPEGQFTFLGVPSGQYVLQAVRTPSLTFVVNAVDGKLVSTSATSPSEPTLWAAVPLLVEEADVTGVALALQTSLRVSGRLAFEGASPRPDTAQLQRVSVTLVPVQAGAGRAGGRPFQAIPSPDGSFASTGYLPGRWSVIAPTWPALKWIVKGVSVADTDVSDIPAEIGDRDISNLAITYTDQPAHLTGTVRDASGALDPAALVVVFPPDHRVWGWPNGLHTRSTHASSTGVFSLTLAPGKYEVAAVSDDRQSDWQDPVFLQRLVVFAMHIELRDADTRTEELKTVPIR